MRTIVYVFWFVLAGLGLAIGYAVAGWLLCITIIGIPFGLAAFRLAGHEGLALRAHRRAEPRSACGALLRRQRALVRAVGWWLLPDPRRDGSPALPHDHRDPARHRELQARRARVCAARQADHPGRLGCMPRPQVSPTASFSALAMRRVSSSSIGPTTDPMRRACVRLLRARSASTRLEIETAVALPPRAASDTIQVSVTFASSPPSSRSSGDDDLRTAPCPTQSARSARASRGSGSSRSSATRAASGRASTRAPYELVTGVTRSGCDRRIGKAGWWTWRCSSSLGSRGRGERRAAARRALGGRSRRSDPSLQACANRPPISARPRRQARASGAVEPRSTTRLPRNEDVARRSALDLLDQRVDPPPSRGRRAASRSR